MTPTAELSAPGTPDRAGKRPGCGELAALGRGARQVPGSASAWVLDLVSRRPARAPVLHSGREAAYVEVAGHCVGVLTAGAALVPCGVRTALPALPLLPGADVLVGDGAIELPGCRVEVVATVGTTVDRLTHDGVRRVHDRARRLAINEHGRRLSDVAALLPGGAVRRLAARDPSCVGDLLGRGPGLTPLGDDVLSGWLLAAVAAGDPGAPAVSAEVSRLAGRTTLLSATLLACAGRGEALPEARAFLRALAGAPDDAVAPALDRLVAVGGTSGAGLALGCLLSLEGAVR